MVTHKTTETNILELIKLKASNSLLKHWFWYKKSWEEIPYRIKCRKRRQLPSFGRESDQQPACLRMYVINGSLTIKIINNKEHQSAIFINVHLRHAAKSPCNHPFSEKKRVFLHVHLILWQVSPLCLFPLVLKSTFLNCSLQKTKISRKKYMKQHPLEKTPSNS